MMKKYFANGLQYMTVQDGYVAQTGEALFEDTPTAAELTSAFPGYAAAVAAQTAATAKAGIQAQLDALDSPRLAEDLIELLISKNVIALADLPSIQQSRLNEKQSLRGQLASTG